MRVPAQYHYTSHVIDEFQYLRFVQDGWITGLGGALFGSNGIIVNCPIVARLLRDSDDSDANSASIRNRGFKTQSICSLGTAQSNPGYSLH